MGRKNRSKGTFQPIHWLLLAVGTLILLCFPYGLLEGINLLGFNVRLNRYAQFGDFVGGILSLVTLVLVYLTYQSQRYEVRLMRIQGEQQEIARRFEAMLVRRAAIRESVFKGEKQGWLAIQQMVVSIDREWKRLNTGGSREWAYDQTVKYFDDNVRPLLLPYLLNAYWILNSINSGFEPNTWDSSWINDEAKLRLFKRYRAELSMHELFLLYLNCKTEAGSSMRDLAIKADLFKHLKASLLVPDFHAESI